LSYYKKIHVFNNWRQNCEGINEEFTINFIIIMANVLIIDDEIDICYLLSGILKHKNLQPNYVNLLSDAPDAIKKHSPSIIFLDNHLPDGMGMDFIHYIKKHSPSTKIIMITAYDTSADRTKALELGVDGFIGKPFTRDIIYQTVEQVTGLTSRL
jgi:DNA-binding response OmpR family regulator